MTEQPDITQQDITQPDITDGCTTASIAARIVTGRAITGMSAILLPHLEPDVIDWPAFEAHVARTSDAGLQPAVNMDTSSTSNGLSGSS